MKEQVVYLATNYTFTQEQLRQALLNCIASYFKEPVRLGFAGVYSRECGRIYYKFFTKQKDAVINYFPDVFSYVPEDKFEDTVFILKSPPHDVGYDKSMTEMLHKVKDGFFGENVFLHETLHKTFEGMIDYYIDKLSEGSSVKDMLINRINKISSYLEILENDKEEERDP